MTAPKRQAFIANNVLAKRQCCVHGCCHDVLFEQQHRAQNHIGLNSGTIVTRMSNTWRPMESGQSCVNTARITVLDEPFAIIDKEVCELNG